MNLFDNPRGVKTRWISFENSTLQRGQAGLENRTAKGHPFESIRAGESKILLDIAASGSIRRIWMTIDDRSPEMLRGLRLEMFWDNAERPAVSAPLGDFFGVGLGRKVAFECALFSDAEGRSFTSFVPMPFRTAAKVMLTNDTDRDLPLLFYDIDLLIDEAHAADALYFHAHWRRENPNSLGKDFEILPRVPGVGRFLGCNIGVTVNPGYKGSWFGEGEVKAWFGNDKFPTICGTGTEDYIGTGWGQGKFIQRTQGCHIADSESGQFTFYRYHIEDPVYFEDGCRVAIQTIGGSGKAHVIEMIDEGMPIIPVSLHPSGHALVRLLDFDPPLDIRDEQFPDAWCTFWRQDDWSATAYFYLDSANGCLPGIASVRERMI